MSVNFIEVLPDELINDRSVRSGLFPKLPADLFYPLQVQSDSSFAISSLHLSAFVILVTVLTFAMF
jgi:hypothetical protein